MFLFSKHIKQFIFIGIFISLMSYMGSFSGFKTQAQMVSVEPPLPIKSTVLSEEHIRWEFVSQFPQQEDFVLEDVNGFLLDSNAKQLGGTFFFDEKNLNPNQLYSRKFKVWNDFEISDPSGALSGVTHAKIPKMNIAQVGEQEITLSLSDMDKNLMLSKEFNLSLELDGDKEVFNDIENQTAYFFKNVTTGKESDWIKDRAFTFFDLDPDTEYEFQVKARNAEGVETDFSDILKVKTLNSNDPLVDVLVKTGLANEEDFSFKNLFYPGDLVKYEIIFENKKNTSVSDLFLLLSPGEFFAGQIRYNDELLSGQENLDPNSVIQLDLLDLLPKERQSVSYLLKIPEDVSVPAVFKGTAVLGTKNGDHILKASSDVRIGRVILSEDLLAKRAAGEQIVGEMNRFDVFQKTFSLRNKFSIGGGKSWVIPTHLETENFLNFAASKLEPARLFNYNKKLFSAVIPESEEDRSIFQKEFLAFSDEELKDDLQLMSKTVSAFSQEKTEESLDQELEAQPNQTPLTIRGNTEIKEDEIILNGNVNHSNISVEVFVNGISFGKTSSTVGGYWDFVIPVTSLQTESNINNSRFNIGVQATRIINEKEEKTQIISLEPLDIDFEDFNQVASIETFEEPRVTGTLNIHDSSKEETPAVEVLGDSFMKLIASSYSTLFEGLKSFVNFLKINILLVYTGLICILFVFMFLDKRFGHFVKIFPAMIQSLMKPLPKNKDVSVLGAVYDSVTKDPVPYLSVKLIDADTGDVIDKSVTTKEGRYFFLPEPGDYYLEVSGLDYSFPSKIVPLEKQSDDVYEFLYHRQRILVEDKGAILNFDIPVDPSLNSVSSLEINSLQTKKTFFSFLVWGINFLIILGFALTLLLFSYSYSLIDFVFLAVFLFFTLFILRGSKYKKCYGGVVFDSATKKTVPFAIVSIIDAQYGRVIKERLTDAKGQFFFCPPTGFYRVEIKKAGYRFPAVHELNKGTKLYYGEKFYVESGKNKIRMNIPLDLSTPN